jgi:hypothetical protein
VGDYPRRGRRVDLPAAWCAAPPPPRGRRRASTPGTAREGSPPSEVDGSPPARRVRGNAPRRPGWSSPDADDTWSCPATWRGSPPARCVCGRPPTEVFGVAGVRRQRRGGRRHLAYARLPYRLAPETPLAGQRRRWPYDGYPPRVSTTVPPVAGCPPTPGTEVIARSEDAGADAAIYRYCTQAPPPPSNKASLSP